MAAGCASPAQGLLWELLSCSIGIVPGLWWSWSSWLRGALPLTLAKSLLGPSRSERALTPPLLPRGTAPAVLHLLQNSVQPLTNCLRGGCSQTHRYQFVCAHPIQTTLCSLFVCSPGYINRNKKIVIHLQEQSNISIGDEKAWEITQLCGFGDESGRCWKEALQKSNAEIFREKNYTGSGKGCESDLQDCCKLNTLPRATAASRQTCSICHSIWTIGKCFQALHLWSYGGS